MGSPSPGVGSWIMADSNVVGSGSMIVVEGTFRVANLERALVHMKAMIAASRAEAGCLDYAYAVDVADGTLIRVVERWTTREALAAHLLTDHLKAWRAAFPVIGISERSLRCYEAEPEVF